MDLVDRFWSPKEPVKALYKIDAEIDPGTGAISGTGLISVQNSLSRPLMKLALRGPSLTDSNFSVDVGNRISGSGQELIEFVLPEAVNLGAGIEIPIQFDGVRSLSRDGLLRLSDWHPKLWWGYSTCDDYDISIQAPSDSALVASGVFSQGRWRSEGIRSFGIAASPNHQVQEITSEDVQIRAIHTQAGKECAQLLLETAADVVQFYRREFGFYPQPFLSIIPGGMVTPSGGFNFATSVMGIHGQERFHEKSAQFWRWITAHEIGHQYWGEYVLERDVPGWLWIGLGLYMDREYARSRGLGDSIHVGMMKRYTDGVAKGVDTTVDRPSEQLQEIDFDHNNIVIHGKGFSIISALELVLSPQVFRQAFQRALSRFAGRRLGARTFQTLCEKESGEDLSWFFEQWVRSNRTLCYRITSVERSQEGERHTRTVTVEQLGSLSMPIPVQAKFEDGSSTTLVADRLVSPAVLKFDSRARTEKVVLDPEASLAMLESLPPAQERDVIGEIAEMPRIGAAEQALHILPKARECGLRDANSWGGLGLVLFDGDELAESLQAFINASKYGEKSIWKMAGFVWQGHILDLQEMREKALEAYREALNFCGKKSMHHGQYNIEINKTWIQDRIAKPFERPASSV